MAHPALSQAIELVGLSRLAKDLAVTYQAIRKWELAGRLPRTEWSGETDYASKISALTAGAISRDALLERHASGPTPPATPTPSADARQEAAEPVARVG